MLFCTISIRWSPSQPTSEVDRAHPVSPPPNWCTSAPGRLEPPATGALGKAVADGNAEVRRGAAEALGYLGVVAVDELTAVLADASPAVRRAAARALGRLGPSAAAAEPALTESASTDEDPLVRQTAHRARRRIRTGPAEPPP